MYNFGNFVQWQNHDKTLVIGILGPDPFGDHIKLIENQEVKGKKIVIHRFPSAEKYDKPCHILFIAPTQPKEKSSAEQRLAQILPRIQKESVLLVGDTDGLAEKGAVINFYLEEDKAAKRFNNKLEVNRSAEKRARLTIDARLLKIMRHVDDAPEGK